MATVAELENMPCNQGYIFAGQKIYGYLPTSDENKVQLLDVHSDLVHVWRRHGHTVCVQDNGKLRYETSNQMLPCSQEAKYGYCDHRFEYEHRKYFYHYGYAKPRYHQGKPVCRYSRTDKDNLCWERFNVVHIKHYHHKN